ncbi:hypothetical protein DPMN_091224 [Dreissena polymorpha]|uniref:Uncharacterized protein n=1 Tax=Dreissena polymorpha TaxID=45954 RepID=A0A9D4KZJ6_DREPO|nr:hypothetical protein DPMN_091224 [Dreissena polymorpha]
MSMSSIVSSLVAVITSKRNEIHFIRVKRSEIHFIIVKTSDIHFIRVTNGRLVQDRILNLQHKCGGGAHHQGNLYITSGTALYQYTVDGTLLRSCMTIHYDFGKVIINNLTVIAHIVK